HPEFDQVRPRVDQRVHHRYQRLQRRIAGRHERDKGLAAVSPESGETGVDTIHGAQNSMPSRAARVCTSLSPRPERLHRTSWSFGMVRASLIAWAIAWLDSSAGRMPSVRAS